MNSNDDWMIQEVPTHVEQKDRVFLGMTFVQIVIFIMISGLAYALYQNPTVGSLGTIPRYGICIGLWVIGAVCTLVEVGGRNIVTVVWDMGSHLMAGNRYSGPMRMYLDGPPVRDSVEEPSKTPLARILSIFERKEVKDG